KGCAWPGSAPSASTRPRRGSGCSWKTKRGRWRRSPGTERGTGDRKGGTALTEGRDGRVAAPPFEEALARRAAAVEEALARLLPAEDRFPATIHRAMRYSALGGGKRLRGAL